MRLVAEGADGAHRIVVRLSPWAYRALNEARFAIAARAPAAGPPATLATLASDLLEIAAGDLAAEEAAARLQPSRGER